MINIKDIYWIAGLMEGEGCFMLRKQNGFQYLSIQLAMTDKDIICRFMDLVCFGTIIKTTRKHPWKSIYRWSSNNQSCNAGLMMMLLPLMGIRRSDKIKECLAHWMLTPLPKKQWTHCKNGHELSGDNLRITTEGKYMKRRCNECSRLRTQKYRDNIRAIATQSINASGIFSL